MSGGQLATKISTYNILIYGLMRNDQMGKNATF